MNMSSTETIHGLGNTDPPLANAYSTCLKQKIMFVCRDPIMSRVSYNWGGEVFITSALATECKRRGKVCWHMLECVVSIL